MPLKINIENLKFLPKLNLRLFCFAMLAKNHSMLHLHQFNSIFIPFIRSILSKCEIMICHDTQKAKIHEKYLPPNIQTKKNRENYLSQKLLQKLITIR